MFVRSILSGLLMLFLVGGVSAEDLNLDYQAVMHISSSDSTAILDNEAHRVGFATFRGIAIFADEELAVHRYDGWFDLTKGSGAFHGYALFTFEDGSTLRAAYSGEAESREPEGVSVEASFEKFTGTGRFQDATGSGGFAGRRLDAIDKGGATYLKGALELTIPD